MKFDRSLPMGLADRQERIAEARLAVQCDEDISTKMRSRVLRQFEELMNGVSSLSDADFVRQYDAIRRRIQEIVPELDIVGMYVPPLNGELENLRKEFLDRHVVYRGELRKQLGTDPAIITEVNENLFVVEGKKMRYGSTYHFSHAAFFRGIRNNTINVQ